MPYDGRAVANEVLDIAESEGIALSNLTLQKVLFFCHAWNLVDTGEPLVKNQFEAWQHGPVLQYLYREFKSFESAAITSRAKGLNNYTGQREVVRAELPQETVDRIRNVVRFYGNLQPWDLVDLSHETGGPWDKVWNYEGKVNPGMKIPNEEIASFYSKSRKHHRVQ